MNKWNPTPFRTGRGTFYGRTWWKDAHMKLRSRSLADREIGDRVVLHASVYRIADITYTAGGDPIATLEIPGEEKK